MNFALDARQLADYILNLDLFEIQHSHATKGYQHIGALYTDVVLQAGLNYRTVVAPRVKRVLTNYPNASTVLGFAEAINKDGIEKVISWNHKEKTNRLSLLIDFSIQNKINTCDDLTHFLGDYSNHEKYLEIKGVGNKTLDYTLKLLNFDTIAVDRHIYSFVEQAGLSTMDYKSTKRVVEFAADLLEVSRASIDKSIWLYMSSRTKKQMRLDF